MIKTLKALLRAHRTSKTVADLDKRTSALKKTSEKASTQLKTLGDKLSDARQSLSSIHAQSHILKRETESLKVLCGHVAAQHSRQLPATASLKEAEFQVFSQWGEDGIIQFLLAHVPVPNTVFVEFGVESYAEANTRFLLLHDYWSGLIIDGSEQHMQGVRESDLSWRHTLHAKSAWISADNINELIRGAGISGDIGILSVDIDGVDYWVWQAIDVVQPRIVIAEYNSLFGPEAKVTPPYDPTFERAKAHSSHVFYGSSIAALNHLAEQKGYQLIGTNSAGNNVFFVRKDLAAPFPKRTVAEVYQRARFREARLPSGELAFPTFAEAQAMIADCLVHDLATGRECPLKEASGWKIVS
jgi:hypothetical protein